MRTPHNEASRLGALRLAEEHHQFCLHDIQDLCVLFERLLADFSCTLNVLGQTKVHDNDKDVVEYMNKATRHGRHVAEDADDARCLI